MSGISTNYTFVQQHSFVTQPSANPTDSLKDALRTEQDAYLKHWEEARQAVAQMKPFDLGAEQKAAAAQKVQRLKDQIKMLLMMGAAGDPKANARQIARLAKELAVAVHEYASAGGSSTQNATAGSSPQPAASSQNSVQTAQSPADSTATVADASTNTTAPPQSASSTDASGDKQQLRDAMLGVAADIKQKTQESDADRAFIKEVRDLIEKLKALARQQQARIQPGGDQHREVSASFAAIDEVTKGLADLASQTTSAAIPSINTYA